MLRRFFQYLEEGIERRRGEHVHLIDDVDLVLADRRQIGYLVAQVADVIHTVVGRGVQLHNIEYGAVRNAAARRTHAAGVAVDWVLAVDRSGKNARAGGLARAARADENIRMRKPPGLYLIFQRLGNVLLTDDLIKGLRPPLAVQRLIHDAPSRS